MTKSKLLAVLIGLSFSMVLGTANAGSASMIPPKALDNQVYDSMIGTWVGDSKISLMKRNSV